MTSMVLRDLTLKSQIPSVNAPSVNLGLLTKYEYYRNLTKIITLWHTLITFELECPESIPCPW